MQQALVVALLTPFSRDGSVDVTSLTAHLEYLAEQGVDAVMPCGTTGEGPLLECDEVAQIVATAVGVAKGRFRVIAHVGRPATGTTRGLAVQVLDGGADAVAAVVPYYNPLTQEQITNHYRALLEVTGESPLYAYNIPARTGNDLQPETVDVLAGEGLGGIKDSTKSFDRHLDYLEVASRHRGSSGSFDVFMGSDGMVLEAWRAGAAGCVSALANFRPELFVALRTAFQGGDDARAEFLQEEISALRTTVSEGPALWGLKKAAAAILGDAGIDYPQGLRAPLG